MLIATVNKYQLIIISVFFNEEIMLYASENRHSGVNPFFLDMQQKPVLLSQMTTVCLHRDVSSFVRLC